jgi:outer membrane protein assembly factor BamD
MPRNVYALVLVALVALMAACAPKKAAYASPPSATANQQPDKLLFDRSVDDIEHGHYERARLTLQTLINTYTTSEYLPQAKLAMADSWYREGGAKGLTQAQAECQQVMLQFPASPSAAQAAQLMMKIEQDLASKGQPAK